MPTYDGVVVGAGHNGLTTAAYLSRAGLKIAVLERNPAVGGGCSTAEPITPGHRFNLHASFFMGMRHCPLVAEPTSPLGEVSPLGVPRGITLHRVVSATPQDRTSLLVVDRVVPCQLLVVHRLP